MKAGMKLDWNASSTSLPSPLTQPVPYETARVFTVSGKNKALGRELMTIPRKAEAIKRLQPELRRQIVKGILPKPNHLVRRRIKKARRPMTSSFKSIKFRGSAEDVSIDNNTVVKMALSRISYIAASKITARMNRNEKKDLSGKSNVTAGKSLGEKFSEMSRVFDIADGINLQL
jgi:hypothetical protein